ncbi:hypothetical protein A3A41_00600 [Candidatus Kaiserbacteria bacterium RIFCSPLOWO2_01_FULL_54_22]|nr:MAG: hypothetical protein A3A41_00600 [Candidatus Kaiserbacteria bacterium RIFCSPLOWO2_01_FULL_54_22]
MEGYSLDKWRNAPNKDLPSEQKVQMEEYDTLVEKMGVLDESLKRGDISSARHTVSSVLALLSTIKHFSGKGHREHSKLKEAYGETKEGQWMLAHQEAEISNEVYDKLLDDAEDKRREYARAVEKVTNAGKDLNFDDKKVSADLETRKGLPRKTPSGPSLADQLGGMIP